ncbi:MFS transporter [Thiotrichales bacterium 19S11-10]|nr:MFS transporter [Thiotrichales bacterium 19S11-10]
MDSSATKISEQSLVRLVWVVGSLGLFVDGYMLYISSIALPFIHQEFKLSDLELGLIQSAAPIGAAIGAIIIGRLSDKVGRKSMLIFNLMFFVGIAILSALAWDIISLIVFRFLVGIGVGMDYPICAAYMAEMTPKNKSGQYMAKAMFINCLASPVGVLVAWGIFSIYPEIDIWRWMFLSCAIPAVIALTLRSRLPESFMWKAHQKLLRKRGNINDVKHYRTLFSKKYLFATIGFCGVWFLMDIAYYGIGLFTPLILKSLHVGIDGNFLTSASDVIKSTLYVNIFVMLGAFVSIWAIQKIDNTQLQKMGLLLSFVGLLMLAFSFTESKSLNLSLVFTGFIIFNFFINLGPGITTYSLPAQFYPTEIRATGHGLAAGIAKIGAFLGAMFLPLLARTIGIYMAVGMTAVALLVAYVLCGLIPKNYSIIETESKDDLITGERDALPT